MAKRHVNQYFLEVENQYLEMLDNVKDFKELLAENKISQEEFNSAIKDVELVKANYERIGYIMFLLNKPNRKSAKETQVGLSWYNALKNSSKEAIVDENADALSTLKSLIKKGELN